MKKQTIQVKVKREVTLRLNEPENVGHGEENRLIKWVSQELREEILEFVEENKLTICAISENDV